MDRLNIPLRRRQKTTRRTRRVVWVLVVCLLLILCTAAWLLASTWFTKDTMRSIKPVDTVLTIRLLPTNKNLDIINNQFKYTQIVHNRGLTIDEILPSIHGELALFIRSDGSHIVGLRTNREDLPVSLLDAHNIVIQEPKPGLFLLSDKIVATDTNDNEHTYNLPIKNVGESTIGTVVFHNTTPSITGYLAGNNQSLTLRLPKLPTTTLSGIELTEEEYAGLSTPTLTNEHAIHLPSGNDPLEAFTQRTGGFSARTLIDNLLQNGGEVILSQKDGEDTFLLALNEDQQKIDQERLVETLKTAAAFREPSIETRMLPDDTNIEEIVVDPESVDMEQDTLSGVRFLKTPHTANQIELWGGQHNQHTLVSNNPELLSRWIESTEQSQPRDGLHAFVKPSKLMRVLHKNTTHYRATPFHKLLQAESTIRIENGWFFTNISIENINVDNL